MPAQSFWRCAVPLEPVMDRASVQYSSAVEVLAAELYVAHMRKAGYGAAWDTCTAKDYWLERAAATTEQNESGESNG